MHLVFMPPLCLHLSVGVDIAATAASYLQSERRHSITVCESPTKDISDSPPLGCPPCALSQRPLGGVGFPAGNTNAVSMGDAVMPGTQPANCCGNGFDNRFSLCCCCGCCDWCCCWCCCCS